MRTAQRSSLIALLSLGCAPPPSTNDDDVGVGETSSTAEGDGDTSDTSTGAPLDTPSDPNECDIFAQDCPAGEKCTYDYRDEPVTVCAPIMGFAPVSSDCLTEFDGRDLCGPDSMCWSSGCLFPGSSICAGTCMPFCVGSAEQPECPIGGMCGLDDPDVEHMAICAAHCDPFAQDCPEGEKCVPYGDPFNVSLTETKCVPVMGDQAPGESCILENAFTAIDDCAAPAICWNETCVPLCGGSPDAPTCPDGYQCTIVADGPAGFCTETCDPLVQDCDDGLGCYWANTGFDCIFTTSSIPTGEPCGYVNDCAPGHLCADAAALPSCAGSACCTQYCDLQLGDAGCVAQPGTVCVPFFEQGEAPSGYENVGLCVVPA